MHIAPDKWKHFYVGIAMSLLFQTIMVQTIHFSFWEMIAINMILVNSIGFGFELFSKITGLGHASLNDAIATLLGGVAGAVMICGFRLFSH